ncbi:hypothetical protein U9M48_002984 [Paspalum notatum var. saurae]|uniref:Uncharacterized protein n=1 Tax=Paspalum notatum var. saurae TaxID=547442 RepID=A0AAQ3PQ85_PASNO
MGQVWPRRRLPKVSRFLTSKPWVQRRIALLATWSTSEDCVEAKKIKSSSWSFVPDISECSSVTIRRSDALTIGRKEKIQKNSYRTPEDSFGMAEPLLPKHYFQNGNTSRGAPPRGRKREFTWRML